MTVKELKQKRTALLEEIGGADEKRFAEIKGEVEKINYQIGEMEKDTEAREAERAEEERRAAELRASREPNDSRSPESRAKDTVVLFDQKQLTATEWNQKSAEEIEKRAKLLKEGKSVAFEKRAAVSSEKVALGVVTSADITPGFEQVGTLDQLVNVVHLEGTGAESYKKPFVKTIGEGEIVKEGTSPTGGAEPVFDYADINKNKIVAYAEVNEEVEKLPSADYIAEVDRAVINAWRKKLVTQILNGSGNGELVGIINTPEKIIEKSQRKTIATIDENTLDEIIFAYGGDEDVEGDAHLVLNKLTLKEFAKVKGADKRRAYDIVVKGNTGTINGVPFVCTGKLPAFGAAEAGKPYILYGKLKGYELTYFTDIEVVKSKDFKFKEGVTAYKVTGFVGGSTAMYNGFMSVQKAAAAE